MKNEKKKLFLENSFNDNSQSYFMKLQAWAINVVINFYFYSSW